MTHLLELRTTTIRLSPQIAPLLTDIRYTNSKTRILNHLLRLWRKTIPLKPQINPRTIMRYTISKTGIPMILLSTAISTSFAITSFWCSNAVWGPKYSFFCKRGVTRTSWMTTASHPRNLLNGKGYGKNGRGLYRSLDMFMIRLETSGEKQSESGQLVPWVIVYVWFPCFWFNDTLKGWWLRRYMIVSIQ